ncbi:RiPP maturation radical SAM C-methyltransferase [Actinoplanes sp. NPDC051513]|uniref:RiPP maturation radical SAM C-methyltransferase n=1 Tax=Actinoplanes sp. NPDC051513 TaxID=3363908 RepID=UPI003793C096
MLSRRADLTVTLVSMPFVSVQGPSLQLGLLAAIGSAHGFPVRTLHAGLDLAARLGTGLYEELAHMRGRLVGDWLFSVEAFGDAAPDLDGRLLDDFAADLGYLEPVTGGVRDRLLAVRRTDIPAYLDELADLDVWAGTRVVGLTSTFQQTVASLALARRLKRRHPRIVTVFGGANFEGEMGPELVRAFPDIDFAVVGEGDHAFPALLQALADGGDAAAVPGVAARRNGEVRLTEPAPPTRQLDDLPTPEYAEYFDRAEALGLLEPTSHRTVSLPFESARGCWWGARHHCTFCGLNGTTMAFRSKSPGRVLDELADLARRHRTFRFEAVDNIVDSHYLTTLFPAIVASGADYELFYEMKANLGREQLRLLAQAGVTHIQPGIESLDSGVLALMDKGVRALQNVNVLRWALYYGMKVSWNILWGFPAETAAQYASQAATVPHLVHLPPPSYTGPIWMERFSPLFTGAHVRIKKPEASYRYVYPGDVDLNRVAYFFDYATHDALPAGTYDALAKAVAAWSEAWAEPARPVLKYWSAPGILQIYDGRHPGGEGTYTLSGTSARVYLATSDRPTTAAAVRRRLGLAEPAAVIEDMLRAFADRGLMVLDDTYALALAIPATRGR